MSTVIETLEQAERDDLQARNKAWRELVAAVGDESDVDPDRVKAVLQESGKSIQDLKSAVELRKRRKVEAGRIARYQELEQKRPAIQKKIDEAFAKLEAANREYDRVTRPLSYELEDINKAGEQAGAAKDQLRRSCDDPFILARLREIDIQRQNLCRQQRALQDDITKLEYTLRRDSDSPLRDMPASQQKQQAKSAADRLSRARDELKSLQAKDEQLAGEANSLHQQQLIP
jgi:hypothetical protein